MDEQGMNDPEPDAARDAERRRYAILAILLLFAYGFFVQAPVWNEYSRYDLIRAVVEEGTTRIDSFHENTGDKAFYDGHYYSDKAPGTAILGVPVYAALHAAALVGGLDAPDERAAIAGLSYVVSGVSTVLLVLLLVRFLAAIVGDRWALVVGLGYAFGTIAFPFATMFYGHAASAAALFAAFYILHRAGRDGGSWAPIVAGVLAGVAVVVEIPVVLGVAVLGCYALWLGPGVATRFVLGGLGPALVLAGYNWLTFDSPFSLGYQYATIFGDQNRQGIVSIEWPSLGKAADLLVSERGLLRLAPWLLVAPLGLVAARRRALRTEVLVAAAVCTVVLAYNSGAVNPFGGWTPGPRYLLPALPFAAILVALAPLAVRDGRPRTAVRAVTVILIAASVLAMLVATVTMPNAPELYEDPLLQLWIPRLEGGHLAETIAWARWGSAGMEPLIILAIGIVLGLVGLALTFRRGPAVGPATTGIAILLALFAIAFALPFPSTGPPFVATPDAAATPSLLVRSIGTTSLRTGSGHTLEIAAQLENTGPAVGGTKVLFRATTAGGENVWAAWYGDVSWRPGERRTMTIGWDVSTVAPGPYDVVTEVIAQETEEVLAVATRPYQVRRAP